MKTYIYFYLLCVSNGLHFSTNYAVLRSSRKNKELLEYITTELRSKRRKSKTITLVQFEYQHMTSPVLQNDLIRSKLSYYPLTRGE